MPKYIVSLDTDHIKKYVFNTGKLKEVRGASALLDQLNRIDTPEILKKDYAADVIFANGGSCLALVDDESCVNKIRSLYKEKTDTASITGCSIPLPANTDRDSNITDEWNILGRRLTALKNCGPELVAPATNPLFRFCESCGEQYAEGTAGNDDLICRSCRLKREMDQEIKKGYATYNPTEESSTDKPVWQRLLDHFNSKGVDTKSVKRPETLQDLGNMSSPGNYIALIYADGNNMSKAIDKLQSLNQIKDFSEKIDSGIIDATAEALLKTIKPGTSVFPFDLLLLGGDDLVMFTTANEALPVAIDTAESFQRLTGETLSISVTIAHAAFPFKTLISMAGNALQFTKSRLVHKKSKDGLINYQVITAGSSNNFHYEYENYFCSMETVNGQTCSVERTMRPYTPEELRTILDLLKNRMQSVPRTKMQQIREALNHNHAKSVLHSRKSLKGFIGKREFPNLLAPLEEFSNINGVGLLDDFPYIHTNNRYRSPYLDLVEIMRFIK